MKTFIFSILILISSITFAGEKARTPAAIAIPDSVKKTAEKLKSETRTRISAYTVSEKDATPCSDVGQHFNIKLQVKKAQRTEDGKIKYVWETAREVDTDTSGEPMEICAE